MNIEIREYHKNDISQAVCIWNEIVEEGIAFPQMDLLTVNGGDEFFSLQSYTGIAFDKDRGELVGIYILHPNNVGRCGHICNASYAVKKELRGHHIGEKLVSHCLSKARELNFKLLQFNAVVRTNEKALRLYKKLGFVKLGIIPDGFLMKDGTYEDIVLHYYVL